MEFKTSLTQFWYPEIDPISFKPSYIIFQKGEGETYEKSDDGSEHTLNGKHFDLEMQIFNINNNV